MQNLNGQDAVRLVEVMLKAKTQQYLKFEVIETQDKLLQHLQMKCQYEFFDALNKIMSMWAEDDVILTKLAGNLKDGNYQSDNPEIDKQLKRLGFE